MQIRTASREDLSAIHLIESLSFPVAEAATPEQLKERLETFPQHFWVATGPASPAAKSRVLGFINGMVSSLERIEDVMFEKAELHEPQGPWQSVFGLAVHPAFRGRGIARQLLAKLITDATQSGRKGVTLTCKTHLIGFYQKAGFTDLGPSSSAHGGASWHDMQLRLPQ